MDYLDCLGQSWPFLLPPKKFKRLIVCPPGCAYRKLRRVSSVGSHFSGKSRSSRRVRKHKKQINIASARLLTTQFSFSNSFFASIRIGISESASLQSAKKS